jgi:hypothetical protein
MISLRFFLFFYFLCFIGFAQVSTPKEPEYLTYDWEKDPKPHSLNEADKQLAEIVLKEKKAAEFIYNSAGELVEYKLLHKIIRVNSDKAIEENNKLYIPSGPKTEFLNQKVRVITPAGKIRVLSEKDIKEGVEEKSKVTFRFFALEGIETGSEIEYFYLMKTATRYTGTIEHIQADVPKKNVEFQLISPSNLHFSTKSYNGLPDMKQDTAREDKNVLSLKVDRVEALLEEGSSTYKANLQQVIYKLNRNSASNANDIISYGSVSEGTYKVIFATPEKAVAKKISKLIQLINIKYARDEEDKIRIVEQYLKSNFATLENSDPSLDNLSMILDKKIANKEGMVKLFGAVFNQLNIEYQVVMTCDRNELKFDPEFEAYNFLQEYIFFLPSVNLYLAPTEQISCLGFIPYFLTNTYGLFVKKVNLDSYTTGIGKIKFIEPVPFDKSFDNLEVKVDFKSDILSPKIDLSRQMAGYYAQYFQPYYSYVAEEDKKKLTASVMEGFIPGVEIKDIIIENAGKDYFGIKPLIAKSSFSGETLIENAGGKYLFKIGDLIGPQMEMYQKEERKQKVESNYNRLYHRVITFDIPEGYKIANLDVLNLDVYSEEKGERVINFTSKYTRNGNTIKVVIDEYYKKLVFPLDQYESYRKVINAAADFNKITLVLEKGQ